MSLLTLYFGSVISLGVFFAIVGLQNASAKTKKIDEKEL